MKACASVYILVCTSVCHYIDRGHQDYFYKLYISGRVIAICMSIRPHNVTPATFIHEGSELEEFYKQLDKIIKTLLIATNDWNARFIPEGYQHLAER